MIMLSIKQITTDADIIKTEINSYNKISETEEGYLSQIEKKFFTTSAKPVTVEKRFRINTGIVTILKMSRRVVLRFTFRFCIFIFSTPINHRIIF